VNILLLFSVSYYYFYFARNFVTIISHVFCYARVIIIIIPREYIIISRELLLLLFRA